MTSNKQEIFNLSAQILFDNRGEMTKLIKKAINSGAIDTDSWDRENNKMIVPKIIVIAVLEEMANGLKAKGTSFEKQVKKEVKNLKLFL